MNRKWQVLLLLLLSPPSLSLLLCAFMRDGKTKLRKTSKRSGPHFSPSNTAIIYCVCAIVVAHFFLLLGTLVFFYPMHFRFFTLMLRNKDNYYPKQCKKEEGREPNKPFMEIIFSRLHYIISDIENLMDINLQLTFIIFLNFLY